MLIRLFFLMLLVGCSQLPQISLQPGQTQTQHEAFGQQYMVSTQGPIATAAGIKMFELGGNAFDAATAVSFAMAVERPQSTGIGGGGFMLISGPDIPEPIAVDFREQAPARSHYKQYLDKKNQVQKSKAFRGILSVGVPGMVKGVLEVHQRYGRLPLETVLAPAIKAADEGFRIYPHLAKALSSEHIKQYASTKKIFFNTNGNPLKEGDLLVQKDLAKTLRLLAQHGSKVFYQGDLARKMARESRRHRGTLSLSDLKNYKVKWRRPVTSRYKNYDLYSMSPPSSGGTHVLQILNILENHVLKTNAPLSWKNIHKTTSAMQLAFFDRYQYMGDPDFVKVPVKGLLSKEYAKKLTLKIPSHKSLHFKPENAEAAWPYESDETAHFSLADAQGNMVSSTQTINGYFGSGLVATGTGIVLNNEMADFSFKPDSIGYFGQKESEKNLIKPRKRPLSSMSPTLVFKNKKPLLALGSPSGTRIISCVAQTLLNYLEYDLDLYRSVAAVRYHHQWQPDVIRYDEPGLAPKTIQKLEAIGYQLQQKNLGCKVQAVAFEEKGLHGVADPRGFGMAQGL